MRKYIILFSLFLFPVCALLSQESTTEDLMVVYLKDGSKLEGYIQKWDFETKLYLKTQSGSIYEFPADKIDKVVQRSLIEIESAQSSYTFQETGKYFHWRGQGLIGNEGQRANDTPGYGFSFLAGYRLNRFMGAGIGIGYDKFIDDSGEELIPIFAEFSGYAIPQNTSFSYSLGLGYSLARTNNDFGIIDSKGGVLVYPAVGVRFGKGTLKYTMDIGYKFQKASFTYLNQWDGRTRSEQRLLYKRLTLRFGILI